MAVLLVGSGVGAFLGWRDLALQKAPRSYSVGEMVREEIRAPRELLLPDPMETGLRRQRELSKGPVLFRFDKNSSTQVVARFRQSVGATRESFLDHVERSFQQRRLDADQVDGAVFRQLVIDFRREHPEFPITVVKAGRWAQGDAEETLQKQLADKLRAAARKMVVADQWPAAAHGDHLRLIVSEGASGTNRDLTAESELIRRANLVSLSKAREALQAQLPREQYATAKYLAGFLTENCFFDEALTSRLRAQRAEKIKVVNSFAAGQIIIPRGGKVDAASKVVLDKLGMGSRSGSGQTLSARPLGYWGAGGLLLFGAIWVFLRGIRPGNKLIAAQNVVVLPGSMVEGGTMDSRLMPYLARALMNKLVRGLIAQRAELAQTQAAGTDQLNELEQQLEQISSRLSARQAAYEKRIAELEMELAAAEEENRELIRAKIREARENLGRAKVQSGNPG